MQQVDTSNIPDEEHLGSELIVGSSANKPCKALAHVSLLPTATRSTIGGFDSTFNTKCMSSHMSCSQVRGIADFDDSFDDIGDLSDSVFQLSISLGSKQGDIAPLPCMKSSSAAFPSPTLSELKGSRNFENSWM